MTMFVTAYDQAMTNCNRRYDTMTLSGTYILFLRLQHLLAGGWTLIHPARIAVFIALLNIYNGPGIRIARTSCQHYMDAGSAITPEYDHS
jgi:hypothetical protein